MYKRTVLKKASYFSKLTRKRQTEAWLQNRNTVSADACAYATLQTLTRLCYYCTQFLNN